MPGIQQAVEDLGQAFQLAEVSDLPTLGDLHTHLEGIVHWAADAPNPVLAAGAGAARKLVENIILAETPDAQAALAIIGRTVTAIQAIVRDGQEALETLFPEELLSGRAAGGAGPSEGRPERLRVAVRADSSASPAPAVNGTLPPLSTDLDLLQDFVPEALEHLEAAEVQLLTLETDPQDGEALNGVFRAFHTIKGVAGSLGLHAIQSVAHEAEGLLDRARKGDLLLAGAAIDVTFDAVDTLKGLVEAGIQTLFGEEPVATQGSLPEFRERIRAVIAGEVREPAETDLPAAGLLPTRLGDILVSSGRATREAVEAALQWQRHPPAPKRLGEILVNWNPKLRTAVEAALRTQQENPGVGNLGELLVKAGAVEPHEIEAALKRQKEVPPAPKLGELLVRVGGVAGKDVAHALRRQRAATAPAVPMREAVRIDADRMDRLIDLIGELVIAESMISQSAELKRFASAGLARQIRVLDTITRELQALATSLGMVPVRQTFQKMARLVHDLAKKSGKPVEFVTCGEDTELDKSVVDKLGDPLVHLVRNAVDHGIEASPADRLKAGKPEVARIGLRAFHWGGGVCVEIEDDGRGLDRDAIEAKARTLGLVGDDESLSEREVFRLIFAPGLSTAKTVTEVSGRGVGLDVVKKGIDQLRGEADIRSEPGKGCLFSIRLPLTLALIDGMVVRVGRERYIIPTLSIVRSTRPQATELSALPQQGEMLRLRDHLVPLIRLDRLFDIEYAQRDPTQGLVVVVEEAGQAIGLLTDEVLGQQRLVIRSLGESLRGIPGVSGGAILPDGQVGLILDVGGIIRLAGAAPVAA